MAIYLKGVDTDRSGRVFPSQEDLGDGGMANATLRASESFTS
jgi:hypothetical protein